MDFTCSHKTAKYQQYIMLANTAEEYAVQKQQIYAMIIIKSDHLNSKFCSHGCP